MSIEKIINTVPIFFSSEVSMTISSFIKYLLKQNISISKHEKTPTVQKIKNLESAYNLKTTIKKEIINNR